MSADDKTVVGVGALNPAAVMRDADTTTASVSCAYAGAAATNSAVVLAQRSILQRKMEEMGLRMTFVWVCILTVSPYFFDLGAI